MYTPQNLEGLHIGTILSIDYSTLQKKYFEMSEEQFALIKREDLADGAHLYYDQEKMRRTPGWKYQEPPLEMKAEMKVRELILSRRRIKRAFLFKMCGLMAVLIVLMLLGVYPEELSRTPIASANTLPSGIQRKFRKTTTSLEVVERATAKRLPSGDQA